MGFRRLIQKVERITPIIHSSSLQMTSKINDHFMDLRQLVQKLERITPIISTLQDKQNEWSFHGFASTGSKVRPNNINHIYSSIKTEAK